MPGQNKYPTIRLHSTHYERLPQPYSEAANVALTRYFWLLAEYLPKFSEAELNLLRDACNGWATKLEPPDLLIQGLQAQIEDAISLEGLDQKWSVDGDSLLRELHLLSEIQTLALIDSIELWWSKNS